VDVLERIKKQFSLVEELVGEMETEKSYRGLERLIQLTIQALLDLGLMVISALGRQRPRAYSEIGYILRDLGILDEEDASKLRSMAGLRNILVHAYADVDREKVFTFAERLKTDAPRIASIIMSRLETKPIDPPSEDTDLLVEKLRQVLKGRVAIALLYGGRTKGYTLKGDYDIAVLMEPRCDLYKLGELAVDIAEALGVPEEKVDIVCLDSLSPEHALEALDGKPIIVESPAQLFELKHRALIQLLDLEEDMKTIENLVAK